MSLWCFRVNLVSKNNAVTIQPFVSFLELFVSWGCIYWHAVRLQWFWMFHSFHFSHQSLMLLEANAGHLLSLPQQRMRTLIFIFIAQPPPKRSNASRSRLKVPLTLMPAASNILKTHKVPGYSIFGSQSSSRWKRVWSVMISNHLAANSLWTCPVISN